VIILTIRTDKPQAEIGLYEGNKRISYLMWEAHRQLAETLHLKIKDLLTEHDKSWQDIAGIVVYEGPGSFTGLRIGISVANTLAYSLSASIVGAQTEGWLDLGIGKILAGEDVKQVIPFYGAEAIITTPKK
jgi:tRNA threonylcarbamoyladenosine biosynthesis protein TsaB